ncbi:MAG: hypothetical protein ABI690_06215 [Chloroflexota bacterium]
MTTWKIWRALHNPPALHPVFQRTVLLPPTTLKRRPMGWAGLVVNLVLSLGQYSPTILLLLMPFILSITGIIYGIDCAIRVGSAIAREHENDTFSLLSLSPGGGLGASWAMCTSSLYRNRDFERLHEVMRGTVSVGSILLVGGALLTLFLQSDKFSRPPIPTLPTFVNLVNLITVLFAVYVEYLQSAVLGSLVGMFVPTFTQNRLDTSVYTFGGFLFLQITTYFLAYLIGFVILPSLYERLNIVGDYTEMSLSILRLTIFFLIREAIITGLWRVIVQRLNGSTSELDLSMQFAP